MKLADVVKEIVKSTPLKRGAKEVPREQGKPAPAAPERKPEPKRGGWFPW